MEHLVLNHRGSMSYVTGSHNFKVGVDFQHSLIGDYYRTYNNDQILRLSNGVPQSVIQYTTPFFSDQKNQRGDRALRPGCVDRQQVDRHRGLAVRLSERQRSRS